LRINIPINPKKNVFIKINPIIVAFLDRHTLVCKNGYTGSLVIIYHGIITIINHRQDNSIGKTISAI